MGERKGQNKYYPPDYDPKKGGLNKWQGTHALRERARKLHLGILIIRFEMPFNVWCEGCGNHVGMGVRYNAEKTKVGMYYTTPLYEFKMKCHLCTNHFVIRTDPKNFDYELVEGVRRQEKRWDMTSNDQIAPSERETSNKLATDAMFKLEHGESDAAKSKALVPEMEKLQNFQLRWKDDFARNQEMRRIFRSNKKEAAQRSKLDTDLVKKLSLSIELLPENQEDIKLAGLMAKYKTVETSDEKQSDILAMLNEESIFYRKSIPKYNGPSTSSSISDCLLRKSHKKIQKPVVQLQNSVRKWAFDEKMSKLEKTVENQQNSVQHCVKISKRKCVPSFNCINEKTSKFDQEKSIKSMKTGSGHRTKTYGSNFALNRNKNLTGLTLIGQSYISSSDGEKSD